jgi:FkbM family methyltransferase
MNEITRIQQVFRRDRYHTAHRGELLSTLLRINVKRMVGKHATSPQNIMGFQVACLNLRSLCILFDEIFVNGSYYIEFDTARPRIVDCGANIGMSILFFKKIYPECSITAFEPEPETFSTLSKNIALNKLTDVAVHNVAVSDKYGEISFYSDPEIPGSGMMSMMEARSVLGKTQKVPTVKLSDSIDGDVDLLKLDVEGAEHLVFKDLVETGKLRNFKRMVIEYHHHITDDSDNLAGFLGILETNGFGYQIAGAYRLPYVDKLFQDLLIYAYRK